MAEKLTRNRALINEDFMLQSDIARLMYHDYAKDMPIFDFHTHLPAREIAEDKTYENASQIWLGGDHYKWRLMRSNGVHEDFITGQATDYEKFEKFARTVPYMIGNPMYHWIHLELTRYFDIEDQLNASTSRSIWERMNSCLSEDGFSTRGLLKKSSVTHLCTTDDPTDSLEYHEMLAADDCFDISVTPTFRPDKAFQLDSERYVSWIRDLEIQVGFTIDSACSLGEALISRINRFHELGCRVSDHAFESISFLSYDEKKVERAFRSTMAHENVNTEDRLHYVSFLMYILAAEYRKKGWVMQLHIGAIRDNNSRMFKAMGPDSGFDAINDVPYAKGLSSFLSALDRNDYLPRTVLYCLNPGDNEVLVALAGCFYEEGIRGKVQFGSGWWFNDHKDGMRKQMSTLGNMGMLSHFIGMLTDSRSFLSFPRHEYFRRILCSLIGEYIVSGEYPSDLNQAGQMVQDICYNNALNFFRIGSSDQ